MKRSKSCCSVLGDLKSFNQNIVIRTVHIIQSEESDDGQQLNEEHGYLLTFLNDYPAQGCASITPKQIHSYQCDEYLDEDFKNSKFRKLNSNQTFESSVSIDDSDTSFISSPCSKIQCQPLHFIDIDNSCDTLASERNGNLDMTLSSKQRAYSPASFSKRSTLKRSFTSSALCIF